MGVAVLPYPNDPAFTDGDWTDDLEFYVNSLHRPDRFAETDQADASFVSQLSGAFQLSTADGTLQLVNGNTWRIRAPKAFMRTVRAGTYRAELRRFGEDGSVEPLLVWRQPVIAGCSNLAFTPNNPYPPAGGTTEALQIIQGEDMQIIRSGGRQGFSALDVLINAGLLLPDATAQDFAVYIASLVGGSGVSSPEISYSPPALTAPVAAGTSIGTATVSGLSGGAWSMSPSTAFDVDSSTGVVSASTNVVAGTYTPTLTYSTTVFGQTVSVSLQTRIVVASSGASTSGFFPDGSNLADVAAIF